MARIQVNCAIWMIDKHLSELKEEMQTISNYYPDDMQVILNIEFDRISRDEPNEILTPKERLLYNDFHKEVAELLVPFVLSVGTRTLH